MHARLDHVGVNVRDLAAQTAWYQDAFGLKRVFDSHLDGPGLRGAYRNIHTASASNSSPAPARRRACGHRTR